MPVARFEEDGPAGRVPLVRGEGGAAGAVGAGLSYLPTRLRRGRPRLAAGPRVDRADAAAAFDARGRGRRPRRRERR